MLIALPGMTTFSIFPLPTKALEITVLQTGTRDTYPFLLGGETSPNIGVCQFTVHLIHI